MNNFFKIHYSFISCLQANTKIKRVQRKKKKINSSFLILWWIRNCAINGMSDFHGERENWEKSSFCCWNATSIIRMTKERRDRSKSSSCCFCLPRKLQRFNEKVSSKLLRMFNFVFRVFRCMKFQILNLRLVFSVHRIKHVHRSVVREHQIIVNYINWPRSIYTTAQQTTIFLFNSQERNHRQAAEADDEMEDRKIDSWWWTVKKN